MNIAEIIGEYIYLKTLAEGFAGRCPFCLSHRRVMVVIPDLNVYECLHCGQTGGAVDFISNIERIIRWEYLRKKEQAVKEHTMGTVYVLRLEGGNFYIGFTRDLPRRLTQHFALKGALWTQKHKALELIDVYYDVPEFVEHRVTKRYIERFGTEKVRGGFNVDARDVSEPYDGYPKWTYWKMRQGVQRHPPQEIQRKTRSRRRREVPDEHDLPNITENPLFKQNLNLIMSKPAEGK